MKNAILIRGARQLVTLRGPSGPRRGAQLRELSIIQDGAVLISEGIIIEVGPARRVENLAAARGAHEIDASGKIVMPGFVDSHTHLVWGQSRLTGYERQIGEANRNDSAANGAAIVSGVNAVRTASRRRLELRARQALQAFVRHGTTTVEAKSGYGLDERGELKMLRVLKALEGKPLDVIATYMGAQAVPAEYQGRADEYVDWICSHLMPKIRRRRLARFADVCCEPYALSLEQAKRYLEAARRNGFLLKMHAEQFSRNGGVRLAVDINAVSADHLALADADDAILLAGSSTIATMLPGSGFHLGHARFPPARMLIDTGAAVALATDYNPHTSPSCSMPMMLSLACSYMKMTPSEALSAATINGAHALGQSHRIGSLEYLKEADVILLNVSDYREIPYHFGVNLVAMTMKKGEIVYRDEGFDFPQE
jgi:imidazolonepropionase